MGKYLDLSDVAAGHPVAEKELAELRTKVESLTKQLAAYEAEPVVGYLVIVPAEGNIVSGIVYSADYPELCHDHINDAINEHGIIEAAKWKVVPAIRKPASTEHLESLIAEDVEKEREECALLCVSMDTDKATDGIIGRAFGAAIRARAQKGGV